MDELQGTAQIPSDSQSGGIDPASAGVLPTVGNTSADPSAVNQGGNQGANPNGAIQPDEIQRQVQSAVDKERARSLADKYQLEQRLNQMQQFQMEMLQRQNQPAQNPYDPNTQPDQYWDWKIQSGNRQLLSEAKKEYEQSLMQTLAQMTEQQWINQHPNADVNAIRMHNRMNGIPENNLEIGWKLMNYPQSLATVAANASNQTANNFRQPNQGAVPLRPAGNGGGDPTYAYEELVRAVNERGDAALNGLTPADRDEFWRVTAEANRRMRSTPY